MNIKQSTIDKYQKLVDILIDAKDWEKALELASRFVPGKGYIIGKTRLKSEYKIKEEDLKTLSHKIKKNPRYTSAAEMVLFLEAEVKEKFHTKQKKISLKKTENKSNEKIDMKTNEEIKSMLIEIEIFSRKKFTHRDVLFVGFSAGKDYDGVDYLCFVGDDLVHFTEKTFINCWGMTCFSLNGINNDIDYVLQGHFEWLYFNDMSKFENDFGRDSKFVHYIKNNLTHIINK